MSSSYKELCEIRRWHTGVGNMKYIIQFNDNPSHNYACIHQQTCSFAKEPGYYTKNTSWSRLYAIYEEARKVARRAKFDVRDCSFCMISRDAEERC